MLTHLIAAVIATASGTTRSASEVVVIHAKDYAYVAPAVVKTNGPVTFRLVNDGKEMHHMSIMKLAPGHTMKELATAFKNPGPPPAWITNVGGPNPAPPGGSAEATLDLAPGLYVFTCWINSPGDPTPHMAKGMMSSLTIEAAGGPHQAGAPMGDIAVHTSDYKFAVSKPISAGRHFITVTNDAAQAHELVMVRLAPGKTAADVGKWIDKDLMKGPPPGDVAGGMAALDKGRSGSFPVDLKPGNYALICFVPDAKDGKSHSEHGMQQTIVVK